MRMEGPVLQHLFLNIWEHQADVQTLAEHRLPAASTQFQMLSPEMPPESRKWKGGQVGTVSETKSLCLGQNSFRSKKGVLQAFDMYTHR